MGCREAIGQDMELGNKRDVLEHKMRQYRRRKELMSVEKWVLEEQQGFASAPDGAS